MGTSCITPVAVGMVLTSCGIYLAVSNGSVGCSGAAVTERSSFPKPSPLGLNQSLRLKFPWNEVVTLNAPFSISQLSPRCRAYLTWLLDEAMTDPFTGRLYERKSQLIGSNSKESIETSTRMTLERHLSNLLDHPSSSRQLPSKRLNPLTHRNPRRAKWLKTGATSPRVQSKASSKA